MTVVVEGVSTGTATVAVPQVSAAVATPVAAGAVEFPHTTVTLGGAKVKVGGVVSTMVMFCTTVGVLQLEPVSDADQVRVKFLVRPQPLTTFESTKVMLGW